MGGCASSSNQPPERPGGPARRRMPSGIPGLDEVLGGGLITGGIYVLMGGPGTGKTVIANQLCFMCAQEHRAGVYVTVVSESHSRMIGNLETFAFFDPRPIGDCITYVSGVGAQREGGFDGLFQLVEGEVRRRQPAMLVIDGLSTNVRASNASEAELRDFLNRLAALLEFTDCTAVLCVLSKVGEVSAEQAIADGLIELTNTRIGRRAMRELFVSKFRGSATLEGSHNFEIDARGVVVHPRTEAKLTHNAPVQAADSERLRFGVDRLDEMLRGGVPSISTTALIGAPGTGKTLLGLHFLAEGARQGQRCLYFGFYESPARVIAQGDGVGLSLGELRGRDLLDVTWHRPFENFLDRVAETLFEHVRRRGIRRLFIDGVEGFARGALFPERTPALLAAISNELRAMGVTTVMSLEAPLFGPIFTPEELWSAVIDNTIILRFVELHSHLHRLISIVKVRGSGFDPSIREFVIHEQGIRVDDTFEDAPAVLSGHAPLVDPSPGRGRR
jgi:circadian clock protein KaiC